jgi:hypothetical protein
VILRAGVPQIHALPCTYSGAIKLKEEAAYREEEAKSAAVGQRRTLSWDSGTV